MNFVTGTITVQASSGSVKVWLRRSKECCTAISSQRVDQGLYEYDIEAGLSCTNPATTGVAGCHYSIPFLQTGKHADGEIHIYGEGMTDTHSDEVSHGEI